MARLLFQLLIVFSVATAWAGPGLDPVDGLADPAQEARARALFKTMRCVVCQSESLDDSEADLARDMRRLVRDQIVAGKSDAEIKAYFVGRYGEFVMLAPPQTSSTWLLWFGPFLLLIAGAGGVLIYVRRQGERRGEAPLSSEERRALTSLDRDLPKS